MENNEISQTYNPLESESVGKLILKYSLPAIASSLVSSLYNIVDQIFVGQKMGETGNVATNGGNLLTFRRSGATMGKIILEVRQCCIVLMVPNIPSLCRP